MDCTKIYSLVLISLAGLGPAGCGEETRAVAEDVRCGVVLDATGSSKGLEVKINPEYGALLTFLTEKKCTSVSLMAVTGASVSTASAVAPLPLEFEKADTGNSEQDKIIEEDNLFAFQEEAKQFLSQAQQDHARRDTCSDVVGALYGIGERTAGGKRREIFVLSDMMDNCTPDWNLYKAPIGKLVTSEKERRNNVTELVRKVTLLTTLKGANVYVFGMASDVGDRARAQSVSLFWKDVASKDGFKLVTDAVKQ